MNELDTRQTNDLEQANDFAQAGGSSTPNESAPVVDPLASGASEQPGKSSSTGIPEQAGDPQFADASVQAGEPSPAETTARVENRPNDAVAAHANDYSDGTAAANAKSKRGLAVAAVALVVVVALAAVGYNMLAGQQTNVPTLSNVSTSASAHQSATPSQGADPKENTGSSAATPSANEVASSGADAASGASSDVVAAGTAGEDAASDSSQEQAQETMRFNDFAFEDLDGNSVKLSDFFGKPTLLGFWTTWCPPCNAEAPAMQKLYETYGDRVNFVMIDAASDGRDTAEGTKEWLNEGGYSYPVYIDLTGEAASECQIYYLPTMIVLDKDGNVLTGFSGTLDEQSGADLIEQLLAL